MLISLLISFLGIGLVFLILTIANKIYKEKLLYIELVDAGTNDTHVKPKTDAHFTLSPFFESFYHNGKKVSPKDYQIRKVDGDCMVPRNINAGDLLFIEDFNGNADSLSVGDIIFIEYMINTHIGHKIREYRGLIESDIDNIQTLYYTRDGQPKSSSKSHELKNVKGVVRMKFTI